MSVMRTVNMMMTAEVMTNAKLMMMAGKIKITLLYQVIKHASAHN